jgi:hypothetical protein
MPIAGFTRLRYSQLGKQSTFGSNAAATRRVPWRGLLTVNPNRTDADVDTGSLDPAIIPYPTAKQIEWPPAGPLTYDDLPYRLAAGLKGGVTPTGSAGVGYTWTYQIASLTADSFDYFTCETGDDQSISDGIVAIGGVANTMTEDMPEDLGPWTITDGWVFADAYLPFDKTQGLTVDDTPSFVFGADTEVFVDTVAGSIGSTKWTDAVHSASIRVNNNLDLKRFANGANASNARFRLSGYGRGPREIELVLTVAETAQTMAEAATIDDDPVPQRFIQVKTTSVENAGGSNKYAYTRQGCFTLRSVENGEIGGNATLILTYRAMYNSTLTYAYKAVVVNALSAL